MVKQNHLPTDLASPLSPSKAPPCQCLNLRAILPSQYPRPLQSAPPASATALQLNSGARIDQLSNSQAFAVALGLNVLDTNQAGGKATGNVSEKVAAESDTQILKTLTKPHPQREPSSCRTLFLEAFGATTRAVPSVEASGCPALPCDSCQPNPWPANKIGKSISSPAVKVLPILVLGGKPGRRCWSIGMRFAFGGRDGLNRRDMVTHSAYLGGMTFANRAFANFTVH